LIQSIELRPLHSSTIFTSMLDYSSDRQVCFISLYHSRVSIPANNASTSVKTDKINVIERLQGLSLFLTSVTWQLATRGFRIVCIDSRSPSNSRETRHLLLDWTIVPQAVRARLKPKDIPSSPPRASLLHRHEMVCSPHIITKTVRPSMNRKMALESPFLTSSIEHGILVKVIYQAHGQAPEEVLRLRSQVVSLLWHPEARICPNEALPSLRQHTVPSVMT
jgi:hypothetical protein